MTVVELIEILARYDPGMSVLVADAERLVDVTRFDVQVVDTPRSDGGLAICISPSGNTCARQVRPEVKCPRCGWVHVVIPLHHAEQAVLDANIEQAKAGSRHVGTIARYLRCFKCGEATDGFIAAEPGDAPAGCTLQPVVVAQRSSSRG